MIKIYIKHIAAYIFLLIFVLAILQQDFLIYVIMEQNVKLSSHNVMAILDILEAFETELHFYEVDFDKFLKNSGWTSEEYFIMWKDLDSLLTDEQISEQINFCHTWKHDIYDIYSEKLENEVKINSI